MRLLRLVSLSLLAACLMLGLTSAPSGAAAVGQTMTTAKTSSRDGQAKVTFTLDWRKRTEVGINSGMLDDICPGDGYSARVTFTVNFANGTKQTRTFTDQNTCGKRAISFATAMAHSRSRITSVTTRLCEINLGTSPVRTRDCLTSTKKNPLR